MKKKFLSLLVAAVMVLAVVPMTAFAGSMEFCPEPEMADDLEIEAEEEVEEITVDSVTKMLEELPTVDELDEMSSSELYDAYIALNEAYEAYETLDSDDQSLIDDSVFDDLFDYFSSLTVTIEEANNISLTVNGNTTTYSTVSEAITDANGESCTITLLDSVSEAYITIPSGANVTLDLNGYTLTLTGGTTYTDTGYTGSTFRASIVNQGTLTIENGIIQGTGTYINGENIIINTILNLNSLNIEDDATINGVGNVIINLGGTVNTAGDITATYYDAITTYGGTVNVTDGTLTATSSTYYGSGIVIFGRYHDNRRGEEAAANVTISGGTIDVYCYGISTNNLYSGDSSLTITGGTIKTVIACIYWPSPGTITIGTEGSTSDDEPYLLNTGGSGIVICCGTLNVYSGTIKATYAATSDTPFDSTYWAGRYRTSSGVIGIADAISIMANRSTNYSQYGLTVNLAGGTYISASNYAVRYADCNEASSTDSTDTSQTVSIPISDGTYIGGTTTSGEAVPAIDESCVATANQQVITGGSFSTSVDEAYLDDSLTTELYSSSNTDAPYSYYTSESAAKAAASDTDTITAVALLAEGVKTCTVTLNANNGTISGYNNVEKINETVKENDSYPLPSATRSGYTFEGWKSSEDSKTYKAGYSYPVTTNVEFTAQWEKKTYTHSYSLEESTGGSNSSGSDEDSTSSIDTTSSIFTDLSTSHQYYDAIMEAYENGWMVGVSDDTFAADGYLTRAMAVQILWNMAGQPEPENVAPFLDVTSDSWYAKAVAWAYENGIVIGYDYVNFGPMDYVTTEQFNIMLAKYRSEVVPDYVGGAPYATRGWVAYMITA